MRSAKKDSTNPHFGSKYADLAAIWDACREPLSVNGLAVMQRVTTNTEGVRITTHLVHASGEWVKDTCTFPVAQRTSQGIGSAITYGKRYALAALVGVASDEDDDGNAASTSARGGRGADTGRRTTEASARTSTPPAPKAEHAAAVKQQLKARLNIVDVQTGESEADAKAREAGPSELETQLAASIKAQAAKGPREPTPYERIVVLCGEYGLPDSSLNSFIKGATGRPKPAALTTEDIAKVRGALEQRRMAAEREAMAAGNPP
jgi:hypothetical protein